MKRANKKKDPGCSEIEARLLNAAKIDRYSKVGNEQNYQENTEKSTSKNIVHIIPNACYISESDAGSGSENTGNCLMHRGYVRL